MTELVIMKNQQAVTISLKVAESFGKQHKHVIDAIERVKHSAENSAQLNSMFVVSNYKDRSGKHNKMYYMNRDGFTLLVMGFTGKRAMDFKLKYIEAFNEMEKAIKLQQALPQTPEGRINLLLQASSHMDERLETAEQEIEDIKNRMGLPGNLVAKFRKARNKKVINLVGGKDSNAYQNKPLVRKIYRAMFDVFRDQFEVERYADVPMAQFDEAMSFVHNWYLPFELQTEVQKANAQTELTI